MAYEQPLFKPTGLVADADLSAKQFYFVKVTGAGQVGVCSVDGELALGVLQNKPISGGAATVESDGITKMVASEAISAGQLVGTANDGRAKVVDMTSTGADLGDWAIGVALDTVTVANQIVTVKLGLNYRVTSA